MTLTADPSAGAALVVVGASVVLVELEVVDVVGRVICSPNTSVLDGLLLPMANAVAATRMATTVAPKANCWDRVSLVSASGEAICPGYRSPPKLPTARAVTPAPKAVLILKEPSPS
jgi:hypothetical protein